MIKDLFSKYLQGNCTEDEFNQFLLWMKEQSQTVGSKELVMEIWNEFEPEAGAEEKIKYNRLLDKIHHQINVDSKRVPYKAVSSKQKVLTFLTRVAAVLLLPVLLLLFYINWPNKNQFARNQNDLEITAPTGSRVNFKLEDGTRVWLNNGSKLKYPYFFEGKERKVQLTGEAYFEVAHNSKIPFFVETEHLTVKVTGTSFNVNAYSGNNLVETTLVEGKVILLEKESGKEIRTMVPNESVAFDSRSNKYTVETADIGKNIAWKDGLLVFKRDSIVNVVQKLSRWYNIDVEISNEKIKQLTYTGTFADESLPQVLLYMSMATPITYKIIPREKSPDGIFPRQKVIIGLKQ